MLERDGYPAGVPCWVDTGQPDPEAAARFYAGVFGWELEDRMPPEAPGRYFVARLGGRDVAAVGSKPEGSSRSPAWTTYVRVESADDAAARVWQSGGQVLAEPFDVFDAGRMGVFADPSGAVFCAWQPGRHRGAQAVNEPGAWVFSELNTRDPGRATAFYEAVFGWEVAPLDMGDGVFRALLRMPGYGDFLERRDPDLRRRQAEAGAPEGFEDAVAWLTAMTPDRFPDDTPSHWSITFAVDDVDAAADRAADLGGAVVVPSFDADPSVRVAVLRDPQGAAFTVSRFTPR
jgi:predicted enzyme related to lactoylglutathione lyase